MTDKLDITELLQDLKDIGLSVGSVSPYTPRLFELRLHHSRKKLNIWPGSADSIEWSVSKRHRQAVLTVVENRRKIRLNRTKTGSPSVWNDMSSSDIIHMYWRGIRPALPVPPVHAEVIRVKSTGNGIIAYREAELEFTIARTTSTFLVGQDEAGYFISLLPRKADDVDHAHRILRPKGLSDKAIRVGEWFLDPISDPKLAKRLVNISVRRGLRHDVYFPQAHRGYPISAKAREDTNHRATTYAAIGGRSYVAGIVFDTRANCPHEPIMLSGWHRVVKNTEKAAPNALSWD